MPAVDLIDREQQQPSSPLTCGNYGTHTRRRRDDQGDKHHHEGEMTKRLAQTLAQVVVVPRSVIRSLV